MQLGAKAAGEYLLDRMGRDEGIEAVVDASVNAPSASQDPLREKAIARRLELICS